MNSRERIQAALRFERPDRLPVNESPWDQTAAAWYDQGIPRDMLLADYFGFDIAMMYIDASPRFPMRVRGREAGSITYEDRYGYTITKPEGVSSTMHFLEHKTKDKAAWDAIKPRFALDPDDSARIDDQMYFGHFDPYPTWEGAKEKFDALRATDRYVLFMVYGPMEATWRHRGFETILLDLATEPDWVRDMAETFQRLVLDVLARCVELGINPDGVLMADDLGSSHGPLISPKMWASVFRPCYEMLSSSLREHDIAFFLHSDGAIGPLIDGFVDAGVQVLNPIEAKAGMDAVELRERYGKRLCLYGNIDATKMYGPPEPLLAELQRKIPLARDGGYIMHSDHSCPPGVTLERYQWILDNARSIFSGG